MEADDRLKKELSVDRRPRATADRRVTEDREMEDRQVSERRDISDDDRLEMFRYQLFNDALPNLPTIPGWHLCWLTTTNNRDAIARRVMLGYEPVKPSEVPGFEYATVTTGEWAGHIAVNEMLAYKLPMSLYLRYMQEAHHDAPAREEQKLADVANELRRQAEAAGSQVFQGDGTAELGSIPARGVFDD